MSEIPDDIHAKARAIARIADSKSSLVKYIERALLAERMAERERCEAAGVEALGRISAEELAEDPVGAIEAVAAAIRNQDKP